MARGLAVILAAWGFPALRITGGEMSHSEDYRYRTSASRDPITVFDAVRRELRVHAGEQSYRSYLQNLTCLGIWDGALIVQADNTVVRDWVNRHAQDEMEARLAAHGSLERVRVLVREELPADLMAIMRDAFVPAAMSGGGRGGGSMAPQPELPGLSGAAPMPDMTFDRFCVGASNYRAHTVARMVASGVGMAFPLVLIHGVPGVGKTHLLHAIAHEIMQKHPGRRVRLMMAQEFIEEFQAALHTKRDPAAFKAKVREPDVLLIDDVQRIAGKKATEEEFFDTMAFVRQKGGGQIVLTADHGPDGLGGFDQRMRQQLKAATACEITEPDFALRKAILHSRVTHYRRIAPEFSVSQAALDMIAERVTESGRMLDGAIAQLVVEASITGEEVTVEVAEQALRGKLLEQADTFRITVRHVQETVAAYYGMTLAELLRRTRVRSVARPRQIAMYLCCQYTQASLPDIGARFSLPADNPFDHTTVMHARNLIPELQEKDAKVRKDVEALTRAVKRRP